MKQDCIIDAETGHRTTVVLATDSLDPSGVGHHMITLAGHLGPDWAPQLAFADGPAAASFVSRAHSFGLTAHVIKPGGWQRLLAGSAGLLHVHAGIGWEGHDLAAAGRRAGWQVFSPNNLPSGSPTGGCQVMAFPANPGMDMQQPR